MIVYFNIFIIILNIFFKELILIKKQIKLKS